MTGDLSLAEELVLLATNERGSTESAAWASIDNGIAGARLLELALAGRLRLDDDSAIVVEDERPIGEPLADEALATIAAADRDRGAPHWIGKLASGKVRKQILDGLDQRGVLAAERSKFLGIVSRTRHVEVDPGPEREIRERLRAAVLGDEPGLDARTVALAALVRACDLSAEVFGKSERKEAERRIAELAAPDAVGDAVKSVTDATTAAVMAAVVAATVASTAPVVSSGG